MRRIPLMLLMLFLALTPVAAGCGGSGADDDSKPKKAAPDNGDPAEEAGLDRDVDELGKAAYGEQLEAARAAHEQRLGELQSLPSTALPGEVAAKFSASLHLLVEELRGFRPDEADPAAAHDELIEALVADVAVLDENMEAISTGGLAALEQEPVATENQEAAERVSAATDALTETGWAPDGFAIET